jgi:glyoxylase-like metal-dependent hydrolase (beta-lactamase superfamily II)
MKNLICFVVLIFIFAFSSAADKKGFELIHPNIYRLQDVSNVYLLKSGTSGMLIDAGSGRLTEAIARVGVEQIDWVLHTHFHRDQCLGSADLKNTGTKIAIGKLEEDFLQPTVSKLPVNTASRYLLSNELSDYGRRMEPFQKPGVDRSVSEGDHIIWNEFSIRVIDTPGHTRGSVSYLVEVDGQLICFSGDLIIQGGYAHNLYSMQWIYLQNPGLDSCLTSIDKISTLQPEIMLPSHGPAIIDPQADLGKLRSRLRGLRNQLTGQRAGRWNWSGFVQVSEHVIQDCGTTSLLIISESGDAMLFDCGKDFTSERLSEAKQKFGIKNIDVIIPSHWHYDHIDGIPALAASEGAEIWVWEKLREHVEHPEYFLTTCWTNTKFKADRILSEGETFEWGGYTFQVHHNPVHMEEHMGLSALVDGIKFYLIGDGSSSNREGYMRSSIHCYNGISTQTGLIKTAQSFYDADPYICLPAHSNGFALHNDTRQEFREWAVITTDAITALLPPGHSELGFNPYWANFYPAKFAMERGEEKDVLLRIKNTASHYVSGKIWMKSSDDIQFRKKTIDFNLGPGENGEIPVNIRVKVSCLPGTYIITADIEFDHEFFGEYPQGYIIIDE